MIINQLLLKFLLAMSPLVTYTEDMVFETKYILASLPLRKHKLEKPKREKGAVHLGLLCSGLRGGTADP